MDARESERLARREREMGVLRVEFAKLRQLPAQLELSALARIQLELRPELDGSQG